MYLHMLTSLVGSNLLVYKCYETTVLCDKVLACIDPWSQTVEVSSVDAISEKVKVSCVDPGSETVKISFIDPGSETTDVC